MSISLPSMRMKPDTFRIILLAFLIFVRFGMGFVGSAPVQVIDFGPGTWIIRQVVYVILTYFLAQLFIMTIPKTDRYLYNLSKPNKKLYLTVSIALFTLAISTISDLLFVGGEWSSKFSNIGNPIFFAVFSIELASVIIIEFIFAALPEELLFRGFLWGYLRQCKYSDFSILCIQAILFWAGHHFYYDSPMIWINVLISGLIFGIVAWKTKSLFLSAIVHACWNSASVLVAIPKV